jgi:hypothetical protein
MRSVLLVCAFAVASCAPSAKLHPTVASIYSHQDTTTVTFQVPAGWRVRPSEQRSGAWRVVPEQAAADATHPDIVVEYYHYSGSTGGTDQDKEAESELEDVHGHNDEHVVMDVADKFGAGRHGQLRVYRYRSDYWGDRRIVFVVQADRVVIVRLYATTPSEADACQPQLEEIARSVRFSKA